MAAVTVYAQANDMDWDATDGWNTVSGGGGTAYTDPQNGTDTFTCDLNGKTNVVLNKTVTVTLIQESGAGYISVGAARSLTANVTYSGTSTSGMVRVSGSGALTGVGTFTASAGGYCVMTSSGGTVALSSAGTVLSSTSSGRAYNNTSAGTSTISGLISVSSTGTGITSTAGTLTHTGNIVQTAGTGVGVRVSGGTFTLDGLPLWETNVLPTNGALQLNNAGATAVWTGARAIADSQQASIQVTAGTLDLTSLVLSNSGKCHLICDGTLTLGSGGTAAVIRNQTSAAQTLIVSGTAVTVTGPVIPAEADVETGVEYGYAGDLQTGTLTGGVTLGAFEPGAWR